jgi:hypothetical protein
MPVFRKRKIFKDFEKILNETYVKKNVNMQLSLLVFWLET